MGCRHALFIFNCTRAMEIAADLIGIREGDEVIVPAITFIATALPVLQRKAKVVFADLDYIDPESVEEKITDRTRAIYVVHHCGCPVDMDPILEVARKRDIAVVEDSPMPSERSTKGRSAGAWGTSEPSPSTP